MEANLTEYYDWYSTKATVHTSNNQIRITSIDFRATSSQHRVLHIPVCCTSNVPLTLAPQAWHVSPLSCTIVESEEVKLAVLSTAW